MMVKLSNEILNKLLEINNPVYAKGVRDTIDIIIEGMEKKC